MSTLKLENTPRDVAIAQMIRRLNEWHENQTRFLALIRDRVDLHEAMNDDQKNGYAAALLATEMILQSFPLRVDSVPGGKLVSMTMAGQMNAKGPLQ